MRPAGRKQSILEEPLKGSTLGETEGELTGEVGEVGGEGTVGACVLSVCEGGDVYTGSCGELGIS